MLNSRRCQGPLAGTRLYIHIAVPFLWWNVDISTEKKGSFHQTDSISAYRENYSCFTLELLANITKSFHNMPTTFLCFLWLFSLIALPVLYSFGPAQDRRWFPNAMEQSSSFFEYLVNLNAFLVNLPQILYKDTAKTQLMLLLSRINKMKSTLYSDIFMEIS